MSTAIRIEKSLDDVPVYKIYRMEKGLSKKELKVLCLTTTDIEKVKRMIIEW